MSCESKEYGLVLEKKAKRLIVELLSMLKNESFDRFYYIKVFSNYSRFTIVYCFKEFYFIILINKKR